MKRFRQTGPGGQQTDNVFGRLVTTLTNARIATENNALYQTIFGLIKLTTKLDDDTRGAITTIQAQLPAPTIPPTPVAGGTESYITVNTEILTLPNSKQLVAGDNITLTVSGNTLVVASEAETVDHVVMSDGGIPVPEPLNDGAGSFIYIPYNP